MKLTKVLEILAKADRYPVPNWMGEELCEEDVILSAHNFFVNHETWDSFIVDWSHPRNVEISWMEDNRRQNCWIVDGSMIDLTVPLKTTYVPPLKKVLAIAKFKMYDSGDAHAFAGAMSWSSGPVLIAYTKNWAILALGYDDDETFTLMVQDTQGKEIAQWVVDESVMQLADSAKVGLALRKVSSQG